MLVRYAGDPKWHERILLGQSAHDPYKWIIVTPDSDVYIEDLRKDPEEVRLVPIGGGRPAGLTGPTYIFRAPPTAAEMAKFNREAKIVLDAEQPLPIEEGKSILKEKDKDAAAERSDGDNDEALPNPAQKVAPAPAGRAWYTTAPSSDDALAAGVLLDGNYESCIITGHMGVFILKDGATVFGERLKVTTREVHGKVARQLAEIRVSLLDGEKWAKVDKDATPGREKRDTPEPGDARCLPVKTAGSTRRNRDWKEVSDDSTEIAMESWPVDGPRAALWVVAFLARFAGGGPEAYHRWWRAICKLTIADWGVPEHFQLCRYLQLAGTYDQLDLGNLAIAEAITRRMQLIEYQFWERARESQRGGMAGGIAPASVTGFAVMTSDESDLFDGVGRLDSVVCACPRLIEWISAELKKTADIDKHARKAREEKALAKGLHDLSAPPLNVDLPKTPAPKPKGPGKGGKDGKS